MFIVKARAMKITSLLCGTPMGSTTMIYASIENHAQVPGAGIPKNYCATNSGSPEVEPRFCPWLILFKY